MREKTGQQSNRANDKLLVSHPDGLKFLCGKQIHDRGQIGLVPLFAWQREQYESSVLAQRQLYEQKRIPAMHGK